MEITPVKAMAVKASCDTIPCFSPTINTISENSEI